MMEEDHFHQAYAKALAQALQAKYEEDETEKEKRCLVDDEQSHWTRVHKAYRELCHDDPIISGGDGDCFRLAHELIPKLGKRSNQTNNVALSTRLVEGVLQATSRAASKTMSCTLRESGATNGKHFNSNPVESLIQSSTITTSEGYAQIAFVVFIEGPYRCIQQSENLQFSTTFLGSFRPPKNYFLPQKSHETTTSAFDQETESTKNFIEQLKLDEDDEKTNQNTHHVTQNDAKNSKNEVLLLHNNHQELYGTTEQSNCSMEEIFADESDPDDYEYESSYSYSSSPIFDCTLERYFNSQLLSQPNDVNQTWNGARCAIHFLLSNSSYRKLLLSSLSSRKWSDMGISDTLADLAFILLLHHTKSSQGEVSVNLKKDSLLNPQTGQEHDQSNDFNITALWDRPLFLLRDRALDSSHEHDALPSYLQLLHALLAQSEEDIISLLSSTSSNYPPLIPSIGMSALAELCYSSEITNDLSSRINGTSVRVICPREEVKKTILSSLHSLSRILECVRPRTLSKYSLPSGKEDSWIRTTLYIIPMIEFLTNLRARFDFQPIFEEGIGRGLFFSDEMAKSIHDSGLFRELLALYCATGEKQSNDSLEQQESVDGDTVVATTPKSKDVVRVQLLRSILSLSLSSPEILGRYSVRVPDLVQEVLSSEFMDNNVVDGILWASLKWFLQESKSARNLKLKTTKTAASIDGRSMAEEVCDRFDNLCHSAKLALEVLKESILVREETNDMEYEKQINEKYYHSLGGVIMLANCLSNCNNAANIWMNLMSSTQELVHTAKARIIELRSTLATIPSYANDFPNKHNIRKIKNDEDGHNGDLKVDTMEDINGGSKYVSLQRKTKDFGSIVASIRSSIKVIEATLESQGATGSPVKRTGQCYISSKTD